MLDSTGRTLDTNAAASSFSDRRREYTWAFSLVETPVEGQRFIFRSDDRVAVGEVTEGGAILEVADVVADHDAVFGGTPRAGGMTSAAVDEIASRHEAKLLVHDVAKIQEVAAYATVVVAPRGTHQVGTRMSSIFSKLRGGFEVEEVYVRSVDEQVYEPLRASGQLARVGELAVVARRRHPHHDPLIVGIMLAKDEEDAIGDVVKSLRALDWLMFSADARTEDALLSASPPGWARGLKVCAENDGHRQFLLDAARENRGKDPRPMWVMVVQGDEVYEGDIRQYVRLAQAERATAMTAQVATFVLHESQREGWDWGLPLLQRLTHYVWDFGEHAGFLDFPWVHYNPGEHMRAHPHGLFPTRWASARPVRRHCPFRSPDQARARIEDRVRSGWQPHYRNYQDVFMTNVAAGRPVKRFQGWFPEAETSELVW